MPRRPAPSRSCQTGSAYCGNTTTPAHTSPRPHNSRRSPASSRGGTAARSRRGALEVLNVMASEDEISSPKKGAVLRYVGGLVEEQFKKLPKSTRRVVIKGGNHASAAVSEAVRHRRDSMLRAGASATTASRPTTASGPSASRTSRTRSRGTSCRSSSASGSVGSSGGVEFSAAHTRSTRRRRR